MSQPNCCIKFGGRRAHSQRRDNLQPGQCSTGAQHDDFCI